MLTSFPLQDRIIYPGEERNKQTSYEVSFNVGFNILGLRHFGIIVRPIQRIALGFFFASAAMVYAAVLQVRHYLFPFTWLLLCWLLAFY